MISNTLTLIILAGASFIQEDPSTAGSISSDAPQEIVDTDTPESDEFIEMTPELIESCRRGMDFLVS